MSEDTTAAEAPDPGEEAGDATAAEGFGRVDEDGTAVGNGPEASSEESDGELAELRQQLDERTDDLKRVTAEYANYRRRVERDRAATAEAAKVSVFTELLPLADDLERARVHGDLEEGPLKAFSDKVTALLTAQGVEQFGAEGDAFDPALHEAVQDESDGGEQVLGTVLRKGYRFGDRVLRAAMVVVTAP